MECKLLEPVLIGESFYNTLELTPLSGGAALDAAMASEQTRFDPKGQPVVIYSPALGAAERARRQVVRLVSEDGAELKGPMQMSDLRKLSEADLEQLYLKADLVSRAFLEREVEGVQPGREETGPGATAV